MIGHVPRLATFYGIVIYMYRPDHPPPHFHAQYGEHVAQVELGTLRVMAGSLTARALRLVTEWAQPHPEDFVPTGIVPRHWSRWSLSSRCPRMKTVLRVVDVQPLEEYTLRIAFSGGVVREVDCSFLLRGTLGEPAPELLHDPERITEIAPSPSRHPPRSG